MEQSSYLKYLPAVFHRKTELDNEITFGEYLVPFEEIFNQFDHLLATLDQYFAPELTPTEASLSWLATWVALPLDEEWPDDLRRQLIQEAVELYRWRGTVHGLKRYLDLYAKVREDHVDIEEARWPAGMQIGVASQIGGATPIPAEGMVDSTMPNITKQNYYIVNTVTPTAYPFGSEPLSLAEGTHIRIYYPTSKVERVEIEKNGVNVHFQPSNSDSSIILFHRNPNISDTNEPVSPNIRRQSELVVYRYKRKQSIHSENNNGGDYTAVEYHGGSFLIDTVPSPYRFIVHLVRPEDDTRTSHMLTKVRNVLNLEKPAHTDYYLKLSPAMDVDALQKMQIEVRSSIGLDTAIG